MTKYNEKSKAYSIQYAKDKLKRIPLNLQLSDYKQLKAAADAACVPVNTYIKEAIRQRIERDSSGQADFPASTKSCSPASVPSDIFAPNSKYFYSRPKPQRDKKGDG